jgi:putative acetyltransferase
MPADHAAVRSLLQAAFPSAAEADLVEALRTDGAMLCELVDEAEGAIDGYLAASAMQAPAGTAGLGPVAVSTAAQGLGKGSALIRAALSRLHEGGSRAVFVLGEPGFYGRFGFSVRIAEAFASPYPKAFMMALELTPGALSGLTGRLRYARPFEAPG